MASRLQTVIEALATQLASSLTGTVYEPDSVTAVLFWPDEEAVTKSGQQTVYFVRMGRETQGLPDSGTITSTVEVYILAARWLGADAPQTQQDVPRWQVSADLVADVQRKLVDAEGYGPGKLGGVAGLVTLFAGPVEIDHERQSDTGQWVIPELRTLIRFRREHSER